jgi:hypothetical protein
MSPPQSSGEMGWRRWVAGWVLLGAGSMAVSELWSAGRDLLAAGWQYCRKEWGAT